MRFEIGPAFEDRPSVRVRQNGFDHSDAFRSNFSGNVAGSASRSGCPSHRYSTPARCREGGITAIPEEIINSTTGLFFARS
jgi:hypothetical protein